MSKYPRSQSWDLDTALLYFSKRDPWTLRSAAEGTAILGATGSGKTSGPARAIALASWRTASASWS